MVEVVKGIRSLPEVVGVETIVVLTDEGGRGGRMPPAVVVVRGVRRLPNEVTTFSSVVAHRPS
jgi:hypothetical protein